MPVAMLFARNPTPEELEKLNRLRNIKMGTEEYYRVKDLLGPRRHKSSINQWNRRVMIIDLSLGGKQVREIARLLECHTKTVRDWIHVWNREGFAGLTKIRPRKVPYERKNESKTESLCTDCPFRLDMRQKVSVKEKYQDVVEVLKSSPVPLYPEEVRRGIDPDNGLYPDQVRYLLAFIAEARCHEDGRWVYEERARDQPAMILDEITPWSRVCPFCGYGVSMKTYDPKKSKFLNGTCCGTWQYLFPSRPWSPSWLGVPRPTCSCGSTDVRGNYDHRLPYWDCQKCGRQWVVQSDDIDWDQWFEQNMLRGSPADEVGLDEEYLEYFAASLD